MRVVIVGGTGNISTPIVALLIEQGHEVICFNRGVRDGLALYRGRNFEFEGVEG